MKKKLLTAAIMAALTMSTASVFAATPTLSGDANIEYVKVDGSQRSLTNRIRINADAEIDNMFNIHARIVNNNNLDTGTPADDNTTADQVYVGVKLNNLDVKAGKVPLYLGKGLLADVNGENGLKLNTSFDNTKLMGFYGKDGGKQVSSLDMGTSFSNVNFGATYLKKDDQKYWGVNADTRIMDNAVLNAEYVKNTNSSAKGYLAGVKFGSASKKGEYDYTLNYRNIEANAVDGGYVTTGNYADSKGFELKTNYKVSDNTNLAVTYDLAKNNAGTTDKHRTDVEFSLNF